MAGSELVLHEQIGLPGLEALEPDWRRLASAADPPEFHLDFDWYRSYLSQGWTDPDRVRFLVGVDRGGRVRMICPVEQRTEVIRRVSVRVWALPGSDTEDPKLYDVRRLATGCDLLCDLPEAEPGLLRSICSFLRGSESGPSLLVFGRVVAGSTAWRVAQGGMSPLASRTTSGGFYHLDVDRSYDDLLAGCSRNFRANLRKARNRMDRAGGVVREAITSHDALPAAYEEFLRVESSGWKGKEGAGTAVRHLPRVDAHLRALLASEGGELRPEIHLLRLDGECIAAQYWIRYRDRMVLPKAGYEESYSRLSPGHLHLQMALESACADLAVKRVNFVSDTDWVEPWNPDVSPQEWFHLPIGPGRGLLPLSLLKIPRPGASPSES